MSLTEMQEFRAVIAIPKNAPLATFKGVYKSPDRVKSRRIFVGKTSVGPLFGWKPFAPLSGSNPASGRSLQPQKHSMHSGF